MHHLYLFMTAMFAALIMVPFLHRWALNTGAVDVPDERKVHRQAIPRIGGIAIFMALLFSTLVYNEMGREIRGILAGGLIIFFTGLIDDLYGLSPRRKFAGEIGATLITMGVGGLYIANLGNLFGFGAVILPWWLAVPFTLFAVVGVINAINLIDGLDGLAGGVSVIALSTFFLLALLDGNYPVMALCAALLGALLGFLKYNFYPARIFMGDTGSLVVGFMLAFLAVLLTQQPRGGISPAIPVMILGLPIADTVWVMTRRVLKGGSPFHPDMNHVHHKFLDLGFQHRFTVLILYGISLFWAIFSILFRDSPEYLLLLLFLGISIACYILLRYLMNNRERFTFLSFDSAAGIRESVTYQRVARKIELVFPGLLSLLIIYLVVAVYFVNPPYGSDIWKWAGVLFVAGVALFFMTRDFRNDFLLILLYFAGLIISVAVEKQGDQVIGQILIHELTVSRFTSIFFSVMALLVLLKAAFRRDGEFFLAAADFLILGISIVFAIVFYQAQHLAHLSIPFLKGIVLFLALKLVSFDNRTQAGIVVGGVMAVLLTIAVRGVV